MADVSYERLARLAQGAAVRDEPASFADLEARPGRSLWEKLGDTWPARLARSAYDAVTLPGDAYSGRTGPQDPRYYDRATDLAGLVMGGTGLGAPAGAVGAGPVGRFMKIAESEAPTARPGQVRRFVEYAADAGDNKLTAKLALTGDTANIQWLGLIDKNGDLVPVDVARGDVGPAQIRRLMTQLRDEHPNINRVVADRVSGARMGGQYDPDAMGARTNFEMSLPARKAAEDIDPFTDGLDDWFYGRR